MQRTSNSAMGASSSRLAHRCIETDLLVYMTVNDKRSFRLSLQNIPRNNLNTLLLETIGREKKEYFELALVRLTEIVRLNPSNIQDREYYELCFLVIRKSNDPYYISRLVEKHGNIAPSVNRALLHLAVKFEKTTITHHFIQKGADVNARDMVGATPLEEALLKKNLELVCMLICYGAHVNQSFVPSDFMYCLLYESSEEIQKILIDYETDFNLSFEGMSILFLAIKVKSPLILEIIERGANINYHSYENNAVVMALCFACDPEIFRIIWENFDYKIWQESYSKSVILKFIFQGDMPLDVWRAYLKIFMENEDKLRLDLEHHRNSYFYESDLLISNFYLSCLQGGIGADITEGYVMHLLSHGAQIFAKDLDVMYNELRVYTPFLKSLLYMDLCSIDDTDDCYTSFVYFKHCLNPDVNTFMTKIAMFSEILSHSIKEINVFCAITNDLQYEVLDILGTNNSSYKECKEVLKSSVNFPSLLQLARDAARKAICLQNNIKNSCMLYTFIKHSTLPSCIQEILLFELPIYYF